MKLSHSPGRFCRALVFFALLAPGAFGQSSGFDPSWMQPGQPYVRVAVVEDGVYRLRAADLEQAGVPVGALAPRAFRLVENGREVPMWFTGASDAAMAPGDAFLFAGRRNRGDGEAWAYQGDASLQSSTFRSLFTDTTYYWLTWGGADGLRYTRADGTPQPGAPLVEALRDTLHLEQDVRYYAGDSDDSGSPLYTRGEGYFWDVFAPTANPVSRTYTVPLGDLAASGDSLSLQVRLNGQTASRHRVTMEVRLARGGATGFQPFDEADWNGYALQTLTARFAPEEVPAGGQLQVRITSHNEFGGNPNQVLLDWIEVAYPRRLQAAAGAQRFVTPEGGAATFVLRGYEAGPIHVLNLRDRRYAALAGTGAEVSFTDAASGPAAYWAVHEAALRTPARLSRVTGHDWAGASHGADYVILTTSALRASAEVMADYRRQQNGFRVEVVEVEDVFDQFDYGRMTPLAIRRFVHQTLAWQPAPRYLLFWGDAVTPVWTERDYQQRVEWDVPSFGHSPSDTWFSVNVDGPQDWTPRHAIGRIPVRTNADGQLFVEKIRAYEAAAPSDWQKRMLMMAGGIEPGDKGVLLSHTNRWGRQVTGAPSGMDTLLIAKQRTDPLDPSFQDKITTAFREGLAWVNYFGHSAPYRWEIVTDHPHNFDNAGRLPVVVSLGCRTGAFTAGREVMLDAPVFGEQLVVGSLNGAIAHFGASNLGTISHSAILNDALVDFVYGDTVRVLGDAIRAAKERVAGRYRDRIMVQHLLEYDLLGDPATRLVLPSLPDFHLDASSLFVEPVAPVPADSLLALSVRLRNRGLVAADSVAVVASHRLPGGGVSTQERRVGPFAITSTLTFAFPIDEAAIGENRIDVQVDPLDVYPEGNEFDNSATRTQMVFSAALTLIAPRDRGIVTERAPRLRVGFASRPPGPATVVLELDSTRTFASPFRQVYQTETSRSFVDWQPGGPFEEGRTYYWRGRIENAAEPENWVVGRFTVRTDLASEGWQQQGDLFEENEHDAALTFAEGQWRFQPYTIGLRVASDGGAGTLGGMITMNGKYISLNRTGLEFIILDGNTGTVRTRWVEERYSIDTTGVAGRLADLAATVREGDYLIFRTRFGGNASTAPVQEAVRDVFRSLGSTAIDTLTYRHMWIMTTRYGYPETTIEEVAAPGTVHEITHDQSFSFFYPKGSTLSPRIGPAAAWRELDWEARRSGGAGSVTVEVLTADGDSVLVGGLGEGPVDLSAIDPRRHPFLRLRATFEDTTQQAAPQLDRWYVTYRGVPELAIDTADRVLEADSVQEGMPLRARVPVRNLAASPSEAVVLDYRVTDAGNHTRTVARDTLGSVAPDSVRWSEVLLPTAGYVGANLLTVTVSQPGLQEAISSNNVLIEPFTVQRDQRPPDLVVSIDGVVYPSDPSPVTNVQDPALPFVSVRPRIEVRVEDDNPYQLLSDTSTVQVQFDGQPVSFASPDLLFEPSTAADEPARVVFTPDLSARDTTHTVRVSVRDASGNTPPDGPYQVHFRVQSAMQVESVYPYPNPMSTHTTFAFLLRGSDPSLVDDFRIRIFSLSGRLTRELDLLERPDLLEGGGLRIGWNKVRWDGRDEDGDLLATGVYLYKVYLSAGDDALSSGGMIQNNVEKLVIIR